MRKSLVKHSLLATSLVSSCFVLGFSPQNNLITPVTAGIKNWGIFNTSGSSISAVNAWKIEEGSKNVVVAVIDTGVDPTHRDLSNNIWNDPLKKDAQVFGWNFVTNKPNPTDDHGHGTHVSGILGAVANPKTGVSGVAHKVSIMAIKYYSDANPGSVNLRNTIKAVDYAIEHGAKIINYSGGGPEFSEEEYLAIKKAEAKGILFVAAAGNEHQNTDVAENYYFPAAYRLSNIISVAATDIRNNLLPSSNWGKARVDVAAPGENIFSTLPGGKYGYMSGTSQATAFVTGMAALLLSQDPTLKPTQIRELIMASVDKLPQLKDKLVTGGRVNAYAALMALKSRGNGKSAPALIATRPVSLLNLVSDIGE
jgi:subtilisin family serine protease